MSKYSNNYIVPERMDKGMKVDVRNMSNEQMKDQFMEIKIENLKRIDAEKQLENKLKNSVGRNGAGLL
ncbi:MAG: hypothetical protein ACJAX4_004109 [Clostridium sp.]|jgi:hypothetical protein